jgi:hypothetical protein
MINNYIKVKPVGPVELHKRIPPAENNFVQTIKCQGMKV